MKCRRHSPAPYLEKLGGFAPEWVVLLRNRAVPEACFGVKIAIWVVLLRNIYPALSPKNWVVMLRCMHIYGCFKTGGKVPLLELLNPATVLFILRDCQILCHKCPGVQKGNIHDFQEI